MSDVYKPPSDTLVEGPAEAARLVSAGAQQWAVSGAWTALQLGDTEARVLELAALPSTPLDINAHQLTALDSAGAWVLNAVLLRLQAGHGSGVATVVGLSAAHSALLARVQARVAARAQAQQALPAAAAKRADTTLQTVGRTSLAAARQAGEVLALLGRLAATVATTVLKPRRWRWREVLFNVRSAGVNALPIVGLLSFLMGIVVAYQSADQLRQFGANIFIVDVVGLSMLREFAPMITAIIVAGRSGSAYAAQIGTMAVTEEIDAMRTLGIEPLEVLVLPKVLALVVALPLLTFFADVTGVLGGMLMAQVQLGVGFDEFADRFVKAVSVTAFLVGIGKAPVFAVIIVVIGCFQGLQTRGGADSVGQHTTRAVVQATFLVIVADALFSVAFSALDL